uniref:Ribonuclease A-domain domain-containing protein n=1 Tax=Sarcophilus harrisii TaxID=9305 RepID=G3VEI7_SARHA
MSCVVMWTIFLLTFLVLPNFSHTKDFWTLHVDYPKTKVSGNPSQYCNVMMKQRGLINDSYHLPIHTFIHETNKTILNICANSSESSQSSTGQNSYESCHSLKVTECFLRSCSSSRNCKYKEIFHHGRIGVVCVNGHPDHVNNQIHFSFFRFLIRLLFRNCFNI